MTLYDLIPLGVSGEMMEVGSVLGNGLTSLPIAFVGQLQRFGVVGITEKNPPGLNELFQLAQEWAGLF